MPLAHMVRKVYINNKLLLVSDLQSKRTPNPSLLQLQYGGHRTIYQIMHTMKHEVRYKEAEIFHSHFEELWADFEQYFKVIEAAGGLVTDDDNRLLFIYRNDKWDLPKGKVEVGEDNAAAAVREVEEECGLHNVMLQNLLCCTYHTYVLADVNMLKRTWWYKMHGDNTQKLIPQTDEGISKLAWFSADKLSEIYSNTFPSISSLLEEYESTIFSKTIQ